MRCTDAARAVIGAHAPTAVDKQQHALIALILELPDYRFTHAKRGFPVDVPHRIAVAIFRELLEIRALAALLVGLDTDFLKATVAGKPRVTRDLLKIRIHAPFFSFAQPLHQLAEAEARAHLYIRRLEHHFATTRRRNGVAHLHLLAGADGKLPWHSFNEQTRIGVIV